MQRIARWVVVVVALTSYSAFGGFGPRPDLDVPYVQTKEAVVAEMINLAGVGSGDRVVDLGCGDGRIVIAAAEKGARGVGVDLDPDRIQESRNNAKRAGVDGRVSFVQGNLFDADLSGATVVTLYLLPSVNLQLRPKLLRELSPGTRIVSHDFSMEDWRPDDVRDLPGDRVYLWVVPANVSGVWDCRFGDDSARLALQQSFQQVSGRGALNGQESSLLEMSLKGSQVRFTMMGDGNQPMTFTGKVNGNRITGEMSRAGQAPVPWSAERDPETAIPLGS